MLKYSESLMMAVHNESQSIPSGPNTRSSSDRRPCSSSFIIPVAVMSLDTEARRRIWRGVISSFFSLSAQPYPLENIRESFLITDSEMPWMPQYFMNSRTSRSMALKTVLSDISLVRVSFRMAGTGGGGAGLGLRAHARMTVATRTAASASRPYALRAII